MKLGRMTTSEEVSCSRLCRRARVSRCELSYQSKGREGHIVLRVPSLPPLSA